MPRSETGRRATGNALGRRRRPYRPHATPTVGFTDPEVAQVGLTEAEAAAHPGARMAYLPMAEMDSALTAGATAGFIKLIAGAGGSVAVSAAGASSAPPSSPNGPASCSRNGPRRGHRHVHRPARQRHARPPHLVVRSQLAAAQFLLPIGGHRAPPVRTGRPRLSSTTPRSLTFAPQNPRSVCWITERAALQCLWSA
jgi:hypothetical protein